MNTKLVQSLAEIILSLSEEEKILLEGKLHIKNNLETPFQNIEKHRKPSHEEKDISMSEISVNDIIFAQMPEEKNGIEQKKQLFLDLVNKYSFNLPKDYQFNREEIYDG